MRIVFFGTPDFASRVLESILESSHEVVAVVTQPDKPVGRSAELTPSPVKSLANSRGIEVFQFEKVSREGVPTLSRLGAEIGVTCAYGQILSDEVLHSFPRGIINVHASLLPKYRGASPIQHAIINGDEETGITIMQTVAAVDAGDVILTEKIKILPDETGGELFDRLAPVGGEAAVKALDLIERGEAVFKPQDDSKATFVRQLKKTDGEMDFSKSPKEIVNLVRGLSPWPCAYTKLKGKILKIHRAKVAEGYSRGERAFGETLAADKKSGIIVAAGDGAVKIEILQLEGSRKMTAEEFIPGRKIAVGDILGR